MTSKDLLELEEGTYLKLSHKLSKEDIKNIKAFVGEEKDDEIILHVSGDGEASIVSITNATTGKTLDL